MFKAFAKNDLRALLGVLGVALAVRILACWVWAADLTHDRDAYLGIARNISAGNGFCSPDTTTPTAYRPPVYPILLGVFQRAFPDGLAVAVLNIAAGVATVWSVWSLSEHWWKAPPWQRIIAGLIIALDPLLVRYTAQPMTECLFTALTAWTLVGLSCALRQEETSHPLLTGVIAGLGILCRPTLLPYVGLMTVILFGIAVARKVFSSWRTCVMFTAGWLVLVGLWAGRNHVVMGQPILTTTHGGYTLLLGNNPVFYNEVARKPWGTVWSHDSLVQWQASLAEKMRNDLGDQVSEVAADEWHVREATHAMHDDPDGFHAAVLYRIRSFWSLTPRGSEGRFTALIALWYAALFILAAMGLVTAIMRRHPAALLGGLLISTVAVLHLLYWTDTRMRAPLHPVLVVFAVGAFSLRARAAGSSNAASEITNRSLESLSS